MADRVSTLSKVRAAVELHRLGIARYTLPSLDAPAGEDPDGPTIGEVALTDRRPSPEAEVVAADLRRRLAGRMRRLTDAERSILFARFLGWSLEDVGVATHYSRERVRQIEREAREKILSVNEPEPAAAPVRPRRERPEADPRHARMRELWDLLRQPALLSNEREQLEREHRALAEELRAEKST